MQEVACHEVSSGSMSHALEAIRSRTFGRWHDMRYGYMSQERLWDMYDELLDHAAARAAENPGPDESMRAALLTAAECSMGLLSAGCFPDGDQEITFSLIDESLSSETLVFKRLVKQAPTAATWIGAFEACVVSGLIRDRRQMVGPLLAEDYAPAIRDGVPYSDLTSTSGPADLAAMDALCGYLSRPPAHRPHEWPEVPLCKPNADERADAARELDAAGPLTPDQRLLRVLLDDDRAAFEAALVSRLVEYRESRRPDASPRSLLPMGVLALVTLAGHVHGWELRVRSGYLPTTTAPGSGESEPSG
ncbi:immunity 49 family protein [Streptomyces sp. NPDC048257]|uniref:immunity 49 family protein n=1 Tax=Streptomyces sp. NPDC048257 TaxID=3365526 RepID=UPI00371BC622